MSRPAAAEATHRFLCKGARVPVPEYTGIYKLHLEAKATLGNSDLREMQQIQWGVGRNTWIALKTVKLFESLVEVITVAERICTVESCPVMNCGKQIQYAWADEKNRKPKLYPAIEYMEKLVEWGHRILCDDQIVPQDQGCLTDESFPEDFLVHMKKLHARMFRVYAHLYTGHFEDVQACRTGLSEAVLNYNFKAWLFFVRKFELVTDDDIAPLRHLIDKFEALQDEHEAEHGGRR